MFTLITPFRPCLATLSALVLVAMASGCGSATSGRRGSSDYARYVYSLHESSPTNWSQPRNSLTAPLSIAVVEVGEVSPAPAMLKSLRAESAVFRRVDGIVSPDGASDCSSRPPPFAGADRASELRKMQNAAQDLGASYLLVVGATTDYRSRMTGAAVLDLTIVGAYVAPTRQIVSETRAVASLMDVRTGRLLLNAATQAKGDGFASAAGEVGDIDRLVERTRDDAFGDLSRQIIEECRIHAGMSPAPATAGSGQHSDREVSHAFGR